MSEPNPLTPKQTKVLKFIYDRIKKENLPPTIREIAGRFNFSSTGTVRDYLKALAQKGYIKISSKKSRAIELIKDNLFQIPIIGTVMAGVPNLATEDIEGYFSLDSMLYPNNDIFALRVKGDSMIDAGIFPDDLVLVKHQQMAQVGETVVALIGDEATVKTLRRKGHTYFLEPANRRYNVIPLNENSSIIGRVINVIRKL